MIDTLTITGRITRDPELRYTPSGAAVAEFTIAQSDSRKTESGEWETTRQLFLDCTAWNQDRGNNPKPWAEIAASFTKGQQVAVRGKLHTRKWETKDGQKRSKVEFLAEAIYTTPDTPAPQQGQQAANWGPTTTQQAQGHTWGNPAPTGQQAMNNAQANVNSVMNEQPPF